jgi:hypothetical protein
MLYKPCRAVGGELFSSAGHIVPLFVSHLGYFSATKTGSRGPDVARGPYVAPSCSRGMVGKKGFKHGILLQQESNSIK